MDTLKLLLGIAVVPLAMVASDFTFEEAQLLHETDFVFEGKPTVVDWDDDGLPDVLFGERVPGGNDATQAYVTFWKNSGTTNSPDFSKTATIGADGGELCVGVG